MGHIISKSGPVLLCPAVASQEKFPSPALKWPFSKGFMDCSFITLVRSSCDGYSTLNYVEKGQKSIIRKTGQMILDIDSTFLKNIPAILINTFLSLR